MLGVVLLKRICEIFYNCELTDTVNIWFFLDKIMHKLG